MQTNPVVHDLLIQSESSVSSLLCHVQLDESCSSLFLFLLLFFCDLFEFLCTTADAVRKVYHLVVYAVVQRASFRSDFFSPKKRKSLDWILALLRPRVQAGVSVCSSDGVAGKCNVETDDVRT